MTTTIFKLHRLPATTAICGRSRTSIYRDIAAGLFTPPVVIGSRAVAWPSDEIEALNAARAAGMSGHEIRVLVERLIEARKSKADALIERATGAAAA